MYSKVVLRAIWVNPVNSTQRVSGEYIIWQSNVVRLLHDLGKSHYHDVVPLAKFSLTLSCHSFLSSIAFGRSLRLHPVSVQNCCRWVLAGRPTTARPCEWVHRSRLWVGPYFSSSVLQCQTFDSRELYTVQRWSILT